MISLYSQEEIYKMHIHDIRNEGKEEGRAEGKEDMIIEMLKDNVDLLKISKFSHFSLEKINELKARLTNNLQSANE